MDERLAEEQETEYKHRLETVSQMCKDTAQTLHEVEKENDQLEARLEAVLALHTGIGPWILNNVSTSGSYRCRACSRPWPCATVRAARGET